ncbi:MAG: class I SAM-dependent methyltransferase [Egibacteraceae bacterium]
MRTATLPLATIQRCYPTVTSEVQVRQAATLPGVPARRRDDEPDPASGAGDGHPLPLTGERTLPGLPAERYWFERHVAGYARACARLAAHAGTRRLRVLDAGCGEGYGLRMLSAAGPPPRGHEVLGVDLAVDVVAHARRAYPEAAVAVAEVGALPLADGSVDVVVSSQVIEHVWDIDATVAEAARVLAPGGLLIVLTPNRRTFSPGTAGPRNPFHHRELDAAELAEALAAHLAVREVTGLGHGRRLATIERERGVGLAEAQATEAPWPRWLREAVAGVAAADFVDVAAEGSLDLLAVAAKRRAEAHP